MNETKQFYAITRSLGMDNDTRKAIILQYSEGLTDSLREMQASYAGPFRQMLIALRSMQAKDTDATKSDTDIWRKRCIAAIGSWLTRTGCEPADRIAYIKQTACRSAGKDGGRFNDLTVSQLRNVYNSFVRQNETKERATQLKTVINPSKN